MVFAFCRFSGCIPALRESPQGYPIQKSAVLLQLRQKKETMLRLLSLIAILSAFGSCYVAAQETRSPSQDTGIAADDWVYLQNTDLRVGVLRSHGGGIGYLSKRDSDINTLNHYDHGRLIQQSYYGDDDGSRWADKPWRYNPVQGGDWKGNSAAVVEMVATETTVSVKTIPRHWASGELLDECLMEQSIQMHGPILRIDYRFNYRGSRQHAAHHQETPAIFISPRFSTLVAYVGDEPWKGAGLTRKQPGWPNEYIAMAESWAAYVDATGDGIGVYVPGATEATCYRYMGGGGSDCSYIAPLRTFSLDPGTTFTYTAFFTLGDIETIRQRFARMRASEVRQAPEK